jgi:hypothetical protein
MNIKLLINMRLGHFLVKTNHCLYLVDYGKFANKYKAIVQITKYRTAYRENCIQIFKTNLPKFFANEELQQFEQFLDQIDDHYYVDEISGGPVGCGGISFDEMGNQAGYLGVWWMPITTDRESVSCSQVIV